MSNNKRNLVYCGLRPFLKNGKLGHVYLATDDRWEGAEFPDPEDANPLIWTKPLGQWVRVGSVIEIEHKENDPGCVYVKKAEVIGHINRETALKWNAASKAYADAAAIELQAKKDGARDISMEELLPFRKAYHQLRNKNERAVFLGRVMAYITTGRGL